MASDTSKWATFLDFLERASGIFLVTAGALIGATFIWTHLGEAILFHSAEAPEAEWVQVVNPAQTPAGNPVSGVFRVTFEDGTSCYAYRGIFSDQFACTK